MNVVDPLYGTFRVDASIEQLILTPEVQRLAKVRLINAASVTLAALGEARRYSHTLGVLHLASLNPLFGFGPTERRAFQAAVLLHDACTPPFAHLFEYHLRERLQWHHEHIIQDLLFGLHAPENVAQQPARGIAIRFRKTLVRCKIDVDVVEEIVSSKHPLSKLLFGALDLDNLDNVARMAYFLGFEKRPYRELAVALGVTQDGTVTLPHSFRPVVEDWAAMRRQVYEVLVFDPATVAAQAVLSNAIDIAMEEQILHEEDWTLGDEEFIDRLSSGHATKSFLVRNYFGRLPQAVCAVHIPGNLKSNGWKSRRDVYDRLALAEMPRGFFPYVFEDRGSFEKALTFLEPQGKTTWHTGRRSESTVVYAFCEPAAARLSSSARRAVVAGVYRALGLEIGQCKDPWLTNN